ncbi:MAG: ATP-binding cassette domain-containing protein [Oscillospiraceae bacterium]
MRGIKKIYEQKTVLDIAEMTFENEKKYALIGANGSGKSTFIKILAGVTAQDEGMVDISPLQGTAYLPQQPYGFSFSVRKNILMAIKGSKEAESIAAKALCAVGMEKLAEEKGCFLSGGETQRMALARIIARKNSVLLLDEPTSAMDIEGTDLIENALLEYCKRERSLLVFSTHSPAQALRMADCVVFLDKGKIAEFGATKDVLYSPRTPEAQIFLQHWRI